MTALHTTYTALADDRRRISVVSRIVGSVVTKYAPRVETQPGSEALMALEDALCAIQRAEAEIVREIGEHPETARLRAAEPMRPSWEGSLR